MELDTGWTLPVYKSFVDEDDFNIINLTFEEDNNIEYKHLTTIRHFLENIRESMPNRKCIEKQAILDIPRQSCEVNGEKVKTYSDFLKRIGYTELIDEALTLSTQASMYLVIMELFERYNGDDIHVSDFYEDNPLIQRVWVLDKDHLKIEFSKKFRVIYLDNNSVPTILKKLLVTIVTEIDKDNKGDVLYSVTDV